MKRSLIALALLVCAMAVAQAAQPTADVVVAPMRLEAFPPSLHVKSVTLSSGLLLGSPTFTRVNKGGLARDSPHF